MNTPVTPTVRVEIYTWRVCPYCVRAKALLEAKGIAWTEYRVDLDDAAHQAMLQRAYGRRSVPQIFINDQHIGGFQELSRLNQTGELDALLSAALP